MTGDEVVVRTVLDTENGFDWHTTEYWQPHNAWYLWTHSVLEGRREAFSARLACGT